MKELFVFFFLLSSQIFAQSYLGVSYNNGDPANSTDLNSLKKISFSGTDIIFTLSDNSTATKALSIINKITFSGTGGDNPLPVELSNFSAVVEGNEVTLEWTTSSEIDNSGFEVERSSQLAVGSQPWEILGFVEGNGNSNSPKKYSFTDSPQGAARFCYRLKQIDFDGDYQFSNIVEVVMGTPLRYELKQNYPNPFNPSTKIVFNLPIDGYVSLKIYDVLGREVSSLVNEYKKAGRYEVIFEGSGLSSGIYICKMSSANYSDSIKMLIVK